MRVLEEAVQIQEAQTKLLQRLERAATKRGPLTLGYRGGSSSAQGGWIESLNLWYASINLENRYCNAFGTGDPFSARSPSIIIEINPPRSGIDRSTSGVFVHDEDGTVVLGHRGRVGDGRSGFGKGAFLSAYSGRVETVEDGDRKSELVLIASVDDQELLAALSRFVSAVAQFKESVSSTSHDESSAPQKDPWEEFIAWARRFHSWEGFDADERDYKLTVAENLRKARDSLESGNPNWQGQLKKAFGEPSNLVHHIVFSKFLAWVEANQAEAAAILKRFWSSPETPSRRISELLAEIPQQAASGPGNRLNLASFLLMAADEFQLSIYRSAAFAKGLDLTGVARPAKGATEAQTYDAYLAFLDRILQEAAQRGLKLRDRLDAQGVLWSITYGSGLEKEFSAEEQSRLARYRAQKKTHRTWIFQANPEFYDIRSAIKKLEEQSWLVVQHRDQIKAGDEVFIWEAGPQGGIVGLATVVNGPALADAGPGEDSFTHDAEKFAGPKLRVTLRIERAIEPPISRERIRNTPQLSGLSILRRPQGTNFRVSETEAGAIHRLLEEHPRPGTLESLAEELFLDSLWLERIVQLLEDKRQVIFYGPPGTGKTYVARELAHFLSGAEERVRIVQFHPAYSYEDFVEGYRPKEHGGFRLEAGPLKRLAMQAAQSPDQKHILIIDEINRGNLPKVLGELYFLLEYRAESVSLLYSPDEQFQLPPNLRIIGTMNTADRSIALMDAALRRRFHFQRFFPDEEPIKHVLRRWLEANGKSHLLWLADVVERANEQLGDREAARHAAIGPAHFLKRELNEQWIQLIWNASIIPYLEEQYFGEEERVKEFGLEKLRAQPGPGGNEPSEKKP